MATVADIEPASLAVTPGQAQAFTVTVRNDGDEVEAYHLSVVDDAADYVEIEPDTLLVHPGETGTAAATITLEHSGRWTVGDLVVRLHIVPAGRPDDFIVVEALATIQSFTDVAALLSPPELQGRRTAQTEIAIANAGNAHTDADVAVSAGELVVSIDHARAALPANSSESVDLSVRAKSLLWRGEPAQHPFVVTVTPANEHAISLDGTFTQLPILAGWTFKAAIGVAAAVALLLVLWLGAIVVGSLRGGPVAESASPTVAETPTPEPVNVVAMDVAFDDEGVRSGDPVVVELEPKVDGAPDGSRLAMEVTWTDGLLLSDDDCSAWLASGSDTDRELHGRPQSGDECLIDPSRSGGDAKLTFASPPSGFSGEVSAAATRIVTIEGGEASTSKIGAGSDFGEEATTPITLEPYPFWMEVVDGEPSGDGPDATVVIHRTLLGDGPATIAFQVVPPAFVDGIDDTEGCNIQLDTETSTCTVAIDDSDAPQNAARPVKVWFEPDDARGVGVVGVQGVALSIGDQDVPSTELGQWIRGAEGLLVSDSIFNVDVRLDSDGDPGEGATVTATVDVTATELPADDKTYADGSWLLGLELRWPSGLVLEGQPVGCTSFVGRTCTLPGPTAGKKATITATFTVGDLDGGDVWAGGAALTYDPTTQDDRRDGRDEPAVSLPPHWIGSDAEALPF